ncbi:MAG: carboxylating nicotinate-nucleotide diphosphorylase [Aureliella sp.]
MRDYKQQERDAFLRDSLEQLTRLAIREDLGRGYDLTTMAIVPEQLPATADLVPRVAGVAAGIDLIEWIVDCLQASITVEKLISDGDAFAPRQPVATLRGSARDVLTCERTILNFLGRLCGIATWTQQHVALVADLPVRIYDTRKTTPGWRHLEKYAVRCGGGHNHRGSLSEAVLIKDNHLACYAHINGQLLSPSEAVKLARQFLLSQSDAPREAIIEVEVDTLEMLEDALTASPDIVLLDNMAPNLLSRAVSLRNAQNRAVELEASGGVTLATLRAIAETGVDRISLGALTHSAINLDLGLDWRLG